MDTSYDGTAQGIIDNTDNEHAQSIDTDATNLLSKIYSIWYLVNFWPVLFISMSDVIETTSYDILIKTDLLGNVEVEETDITSQIEQGYSDEELDSILQQGFQKIVDVIVYGALVLYPMLKYFCRYC